MGEALVVGVVLMVALGALAFWLAPVVRSRREAGALGVTLSWREALGLSLRGTPSERVLRATAAARKVRPGFPLETMEIHALAGGEPARIAEALHADPEADLEALLAADLMGLDPVEAARSGDAAAWLREALAR